MLSTLLLLKLISREPAIDWLMIGGRLCLLKLTPIKVYSVLSTLLFMLHTFEFSLSDESAFVHLHLWTPPLQGVVIQAISRPCFVSPLGCGY